MSSRRPGRAELAGKGLGGRLGWGMAVAEQLEAGRGRCGSYGDRCSCRAIGSGSVVCCIRRARRAVISDCEKLVEGVCIRVVVVADLLLLLVSVIGGLRCHDASTRLIG